jgi:hypothetical protein
MHLFSWIFTIVGLAAFETVSSIDNAVINAEVLGTMSPRAKKWFLFWGILFAVFIVRGVLPWVIVWVSVPSLGPIGALTVTFSNDPRVLESLHAAEPILLSGGGTFLIFLFFHWIFLEDKHFGLPGERFIRSQGVWFYAVVSVLLTVLVWAAIKVHPVMALGIVVGSTAFFITHGFKENAEATESQLSKNTGMSDLSKLLYLEIIDTTFSIDGVLGAFAFTLSVPLIIAGNGIGALLVRRITVSNIERVKKYVYLKNGAMYSVLVLGSIMLLHAFGAHIPEWVSPAATIIVIGWFWFKSKRYLKINPA